MNKRFYLPGTPVCLSGPVFGWLFFCVRSAFCFKGNSSTQSNPTTTSTVTDTRAAATEGSIAATSGGSVNVTATDQGAVAAGAQVAEKGVESTAETAKTAIGANADVSKAAIAAGRDYTSQAFTFGEDVAQAAINAAQQSQQSANDLIRTTNEQFTAKLASNAGPAATDVAATTVKYVTLAAAVIGLILLFRPQIAKIGS